MTEEPHDGPGNRYRVKCCGDIIQSMYRHDMKWCRCGKSAVDGGNAYTRIAGNFADFEQVPEGEYNDY